MQQMRSRQRPIESRALGVHSGIPHARVELVDEQQIAICNAYSKLTLPEQPTLFLEFHESSVREQSSVDTFASEPRAHETADGPS